MHLKITRGSNCVDRMAGKNRSGEGWYRAMFENSHHGIILFDKTNFTIRESNAAFSRLLHYDPEDLRGRVFTSLLFDHEEKKKFLTQVGQSPDLTGFETWLETKEGNDCRVDLSWNPIDDTTFCCTAIACQLSRNIKKNDRCGSYILPAGSLKPCLPAY